MKTRYALFVVLIVMNVLVLSCNPTQDLSLHLSTDQNTYHMSQRICATLIFKNSGSNSLLIQNRWAVNTKHAPPDFRDIFFVISAPSGKELDFNLLPHIFLVSSSDFLELPSGESHSVQISLSSYYNAQFKETGAYTIKAVYENQSVPGDGRTAWKGEIASNTITITVEP